MRPSMTSTVFGRGFVSDPARSGENAMVPDGGLVVSARDAERFAAEIPNATVVDLDVDHYTVLVDPIAVEAIERFMRVA